MAFKMKGPGLYKFNKGLRAASAAGNLDNNPKFKEAVDNSAMKYMNKRMKSNKPCPGCKSICPSCRGKK